MEIRYADCVHCGGQVQERTATREVRWQGELFLVEQVPMGVCNQCGERFLKPDVAKAIDKLLQTRKATRTALIPVLSCVGDAA
ncbi:MAG: type II toxin-antitoxin system MqsA family antitoxin [Candidatus Rokubacteria bacterium]|nr:type II toxin-antitoxin system MqsA family antitoxin [Candidatus Rokubacteria bacterium]